MPVLSIPAGSSPEDSSWILDENGDSYTWQQVADMSGVDGIVIREDPYYGIID